VSDQPVLRIVRGDATPEEVAALVAVVAAMSGPSAPPRPEPHRSWADPARRVRGDHHHGAGAWRASGLPR
jgi:hypothetical protein